MILSSIGITALSLGSLALKFGGDNLSVVSDMINLFIGGPTGGKLDDVYKRIGQLRNEANRPLNADIEKCSRDALIKAMLFLIEDTLRQPDGQETAVNLFLRELDKKLRKEYRRIAALSEDDEHLLGNPATKLDKIVTLLIENKGDEAQRRQWLQQNLADYVLSSIGGLREQRDLPQKHAAYHVLAIRLQNGWLNKIDQPTNFLSVYTLCLRDNLKNDEPEYCKRAREILKHKQLAEISWEQQQIKLQLSDVLEQTELLSQQNTALQTLLAEFRTYWTLLKQQPYTPIETYWASNQVELSPQADQQRGQLLINYRYRQVPFVGRDDAKQALNAFLHTDGNYLFVWWAMTGSGGSGKSRLAYETCYQLFQEHGWQAGFIKQMDVLATYDWINWQPLGPTLLVVDYVTQHVKALQEAMNWLRDRQATLNHPVRWLLVERHAQTDETENRGLSSQQSWWQTLAGDATLSLQLHQPKPLHLTPFSTSDQWSIICAVLTIWQKPFPAQHETLTALQTIDPQCRPLFAIMAAMALAETGSIRNWTMEKLLGDLYKRELKNFWKSQSSDGKISDQFLNLQALVTLSYGLTNEQIRVVYNTEPDWIPSLETLDEQLPLVEALMPPYPNEVLQLHPLQPDIVGEYLILERLKELGGKDFSGQKQRTRSALVQVAWQVEPMYTALVTSRIFDDHAQRPEKEILLKLPSTTVSQTTILWWTTLCVDIIAWYNRNSKVNQAINLYADLRSVAQGWPADSAIQLRWARGAYNLLAAYGRVGELDQAAGYYAELRSLAQGWPADSAIQLRWAMGAVNLLTDYGRAGELDQAADYYAELRSLAQGWPADSAIQLEWATGACNLLTAYGRAGDLEKAAGYYAELRSLAQGWPADSAIQLQWARGAYNLLTAYGRAGDLAKATGYYAELRSLAQGWPADSAIQLEWARGAYNLLTDYGTAGDLEKVAGYYAELRSLAQGWPADSAIQLQWATGACNLVMVLLSQGSDNIPEPVVIELTKTIFQIANRFPSNQEIQEVAGLMVQTLGLDKQE